MRITAVILCGGQGTRLRPVIGDLPKCLARVAGRPFLSYILDHLVSQGVKKVVLCTREEQFDYFSEFGPANNWHYNGIDILFSFESTPLGTGGALRNALPLLDTDPVLVLNGDTYCGFDLSRLLGYFQGGAASLNHQGTFTGVALLSMRWVYGIPEGYQDLTSILYGNNPFIDIGTPENYARAESCLREWGAIR